MTFKVNAVRTLTSPYRRDEKESGMYETIYYLLVNMRDLPENIPMDVNPRVPKMETNVAKRLIHAVVEPETDFYVNNRGIVISAQAFSFNSTDSEVTIDLGEQNDENDRLSYGILDGGHTYTAIMQNRDKIPENIEKYVRIEVIINVLNITRLSDARTHPYRFQILPYLIWKTVLRIFTGSLKMKLMQKKLHIRTMKTSRLMFRSF